VQGAENLRIGLEADARAAPVLHRAGVDELAGPLAARIALPPQGTLARDFHLHDLGERVDDGTADPVQAAGGGVRLAPELPARVERGEDHLQRAQVLELRMGIDGDPAPIVADREPVARLQSHLDEAGMTGDRLVHRVVEDFSGEMVKRRFVRPANVHARPAPDRLQPFQNLDVLGGVGVRLSPRAFATRRAEEIVHAVFLNAGRTLPRSSPLPQAPILQILQWWSEHLTLSTYARFPLIR
jgi:hypothetical protein